MDIDRFLTANQPDWRRLDELTRRAERDLSALAADELDDLVTLYQRVSGHLSAASTYLRDPELVASLSRLTARAATVLYGTRPRTWRAAGRFFAETFPGALWHARVFVAIAALLFVVPATTLGTWLAQSPLALDVAVDPALQGALLESQFADYYSSSPSAQFASEVTTNNIRVGAFAFAGGILACLPTAFVLLFNGANLGVAAGLFTAAGQAAKFWGLIIPHGLLELTAVFISGGAGLRLGWTLIDPGDRTRAGALTEEGRRAMAILLGVVVMFVVAGVIEGFVTGYLPTAVRVTIGTTVEAAFLVYAVVRGRAAAARGLTGALGESDDGGWAAATRPATASRWT